MAQAMTWDEVLARTDLVGGECESVIRDLTCRGPIFHIHRDGASIFIDLKWCARLDQKTETWEVHPVSSVQILDDLSATELDDGRICFTAPHSAVSLFPKVAGATKIDGDKVKGLPKNYERLLAHYPHLPAFDRQKAMTAVLRWDVETYRVHFDALQALPPKATLLDFVAKFEFDHSREQFLQVYISLVTGERDVHKQVY